MSGTEYVLTPKLGLFKPITNMDSNQWGTHWNLNADQLDRSVIYDTRGNVGISVLPPANQSAPNVQGGWTFQWGITANNWAFNGYYDGTSWRYREDGTFWQTQQTGTTVIWQFAPTGVKDAVAASGTRMTLDSVGNLTVTGGVNARESMRLNGAWPQVNLYAESAPANNRMMQSYLNQSDGTFLMQFTNDAVSAGQAFFSANRSGNTITGLSLTGTNIYLNGYAAIQNDLYVDGAIYPSRTVLSYGFALYGDSADVNIRFTGDNWRLGFQRSSGLLFYWHPGGYILWQVDGAGSTWTRGNATVNGAIYSMGGRILSQNNGGNPSIAMHNPSASYAGAFWVAAANGIQFGAADGAGVPSVGYGYLSNASIGWAGTTCSLAVNNGNNGMCWGDAAEFSVPNRGWKPGGGAWADSSDIRVKDVLGEYGQGLKAILQLRPVLYRFKDNWKRGKDDPDALAPHNAAEEQMRRPHKVAAEQGTIFAGLIAQEVEPVMPEMVGRIEGVLDDKEANDILTLDMTALPLALVNAIKELHAEIQTLKGQRA